MLAQHRNDLPQKLLAWSFLMALIQLGLGPARAHAFQYFPEFESLTEEEEANFEGPSALGSEYQSDILTYMKPETWEYIFLTHPQVFDLSVGSLDGSHFLMDTRLKIQAPLNDLVEFRFNAMDDRDFEKPSVHTILELIAWPTRKWGLSVYGEADFFKRKDDTGIALLFKPTLRHEIRIFNTFVNVTLLKRNDRPDKYLEPHLPYVRGIVGRFWSDPDEGKNEFFEYALRYETRTKWLFPDQKYIYDYGRSYGSFFFSKKLNSLIRLNGKMEYDRKFEAREPTSETSQVVAQHWTTERLIPTARLIFSELGPRRNWELTTGIMGAYRWWRTDIGVATYQDWLPHMSLSLPGYSSAMRSDRFVVGLMATRHRSEGPGELFSVNENNSITEYRFNLTYEFHFNDRAVIRLLATGDLDKYGTPGSWEGGNGQLSLLF